MLQVKVGSKLRTVLQKMYSSSDPIKAVADFITIPELHALAGEIKRHNKSSNDRSIVSLSQAMSGCTFHFPKFRDTPEETDAQRERRKYLLARQKILEYSRMTEDIDSNFVGFRTKETKKGINEISREAGVGMNMIVSMLTAFIIGYVAGLHFFERHRIRAVYMGVFFMVSMLLIEMILYMTRMKKVSEGSNKSKLETKKRFIAHQNETKRFKNENIELVETIKKIDKRKQHDEKVESKKVR